MQRISIYVLTMYLTAYLLHEYAHVHDEVRLLQQVNPNSYTIMIACNKDKVQIYRMSKEKSQPTYRNIFTTSTKSQPNHNTRHFFGLLRFGYICYVGEIIFKLTHKQ